MAASMSMKPAGIFLIFFTFLLTSEGISDLSSLDHIDESSFNKFISKNKHVVVYFVNEGCMNPECQEKLSLLSKFIPETDTLVPDLHIVQLESSTKAKHYGVKKFPQIIFFRSGYPLLYTADPLDLEEFAMWLDSNIEVSTRKLYDVDFEHLTQAASGATTGDWFVMFHEPSCQSLFATWEAVASSLKHKMNIATVDVSTNVKLKERFQITKCPSLIFFRLGKMYMYSLPDRTFVSLAAFAEGFYKNAKAQKVPNEPTPFDQLIEDIVRIIKMTLHRTEGQLAILISVISVVILIAVYILCCPAETQHAKLP